VTDLLHTLETLPAGPLYFAIGVLAAVENVFPPVPADSAIALGAFLAGRGTISAWGVFAVTWGANVVSASGVYLVGRRYGAAFFAGRLGRRLLSPAVFAHVAQAYQRYGSFGIFLSRLLPVWRAVVPPFAGVAGLPPGRTLIPLALASGLWYGALTFLVATFGTNLDAVLAVFGHVSAVLGVVALAIFIAMGILLVKRLKR
jgi:membrane protein DedA with SNARE-associated domain